MKTVTGVGPPVPRDGPPGAANDDLPDLAQRWLDELAGRRRLADRTVAAYREDLQRLFTLLPAGAGASLEARCRPADVRAALARLHAAGLAPRSLARVLSAWRGFLQWSTVQGVLPANPAQGLRAPRAPRRLPKALTPDQASRLAGGVSASGDEDDLVVRDRAMVELLYSSGLRLSELVSLDWRWFDRTVASAGGGAASISWLDLTERVVSVTGKGNRQRTVPVGRPAAEALASWLTVRLRWLAAHADGDQRALFISQRGQRLTGRSIQLRLARRARSLGMELAVHPHMLRHSMASHVLQSSGDLRAVQELLGHADVATTQIYTRLDWQHLARAYDAAHPRAKRRPA